MAVITSADGDEVMPHASDVKIGAMLLQNFEGELFQGSFAIRKLSSSERAYLEMERECLAILWGTKMSLIYIYGTYFIIQTDHKPLTFLNESKITKTRIMRKFNLERGIMWRSSSQRRGRRKKQVGKVKRLQRCAC